MQWLPEPGKGRPLALILASIVVLLAYLIGLHWFLLARGEQSERVADLRTSEARYLRVIGEREPLEQALGEARRLQSANEGFLIEDGQDLAAAGLITRLRQVIQEAGPEAAERCRATPQPYRAPQRELYEKATIKVRLVCPLEDFLQVLHDLETKLPVLFLEDIMIMRMGAVRRSAVPGNVPGAGGANSGTLDIRFDLSGYLRQSPPAP